MAIATVRGETAAGRQARPRARELQVGQSSFILDGFLYYVRVVVLGARPGHRCRGLQSDVPPNSVMWQGVRPCEVLAVRLTSMSAFRRGELEVGQLSASARINGPARREAPLAVDRPCSSGMWSPCGHPGLVIAFPSERCRFLWWEPMFAPSVLIAVLPTSVRRLLDYARYAESCRLLRLTVPLFLPQTSCVARNPGIPWDRFAREVDEPICDLEAGFAASVRQGGHGLSDGSPESRCAENRMQHNDGSRSTPVVPCLLK
jgi:hypothetical protein